MRLKLLRLGYLVPDWPNQTHAFFWREACALKELGLEVQFFSTRRPSRGACSHPFADQAHAETFYVFPPPLRNAFPVFARYLTCSLLIWRYVCSLSEASFIGRLRVVLLGLSAAVLAEECRVREIDHLHVHSFGDSAHLVALAHLMGGPAFSITLHGDLPVYGADHNSKVENALFLSAVTAPLKKQITEVLGFPDSKVSVITMGVDTDYFRPALPKPTNPEFTLTTVARLNAMKGHRYVLRAISRIRASGLRCRYMIAGDGPGRSDIENESAKLGITDSVVLVGNIGEPQVLELLRSADCFVLASEGLGEAAPVSVMEAMACELPVICSRIGGTTDMICDGVDGLLVDQGDVAGLESAIHTLATNREMRTRIGVAARAKAKQVFDYRITARKLAARFRRPDIGTVDHPR